MKVGPRAQGLIDEGPQAGASSRRAVSCAGVLYQCGLPISFDTFSGDRAKSCELSARATPGDFAF
jgi:hypothetical protein